MEGSTQEKPEANKKYFEQFNTIADIAKYDIQLWLRQAKCLDIASLIATKSIVTFVPTNLKFNKMMKDDTEKFSSGWYNRGDARTGSVGIYCQRKHLNVSIYSKYSQDSIYH
eukprot:2572414-Ditylum_brightwellii.AAC.1